ncbi:MAG: FAD-binding oxidoreductase [Candidatus Abyssobacteria bacterium SURF_5]|uniref:FAD-binding oxidoreductase n=1 Tax=Abyssobacteria bacterium (strain SURF_5) TaxID=2093360 RepID=A0A3A4NDC9_ABYX5|nr:MAG: FAD-binding oxidoreductase [Candidatus Abyssubacteria bacterium SURF_5]
MKMGRIADAVVVGGGIAGVSVACHLAKNGIGKIILLEKEPLLGMGSSAASAGIIYHHFSEPVNRQLSRASLQALLEFEDRFETDIDLRQSGCIQTAGTPEDLAVLEGMHRGLAELKVHSRMLAPTELTHLIPGLVSTDLLGALFTPGDGYFDPHGVIQGYAAAARRLGVDFVTNTPAIDLVVHSGKIEGVRTPAGLVSTRIVVDSAGPLAADVARMAAVRVPIVTVKRQIFISAPTAAVRNDAPFYFDRNPPFYFRPESGGLLMSIAEMDECGADNLVVDWRSAEILAERALNRLPALESTRIMRGWAGLRSMTPDRAAILGPAGEPEGFSFACGFSGHGVMHSPMTGKIVAALVTEPALKSCDGVDLVPLQFDRFLS